jgi:cytochrome P450
MLTVSDYDPYSPEVRRDPYGLYAILRREAPVHYMEKYGFWVASRFADVVAILKDPYRFSSSLFADADKLLLGSDPPEHARNRSIISKHFTQQSIAALEPRIRQIAESLVSAFIQHRECDLVIEFSGPLPVIVIAEMLDMVSTSPSEFRRWSDDFVAGITPSTSPERKSEIIESVTAFHRFIETHISQRVQAGGNGIVDKLLGADEFGQGFGLNEVCSLARVLFVAGNATTTNLIGNAILALLRTPLTLAKVYEDRSLIPQVVEETLRYDPPVQVLLRKTTREVELSGVVMPKGSIVMALIGSANRDERQFADAERFDIARNAVGHLAFGLGEHFCIGAPLARLEARIALDVLLSRLGNLGLADPEVPMIETKHLRGPEHLRLSFDPR